MLYSVVMTSGSLTVTIAEHKRYADAWSICYALENSGSMAEIVQE